MRDTRFPSHGQFKLTLSGNIVELIAVGDWNLECANEMVEAVNELIAPLKGKKWATLVDLHDWRLGTPEFAQAINTATAKLIANGLRREAYVGLTTSISRHQIVDMRPRHPDYGFEIFESREDAINWLSRDGFALA